MRGLGLVVVACWWLAACWGDPGAGDVAVGGKGGTGGAPGGGTGGTAGGAGNGTGANATGGGAWVPPRWSANLPQGPDTCATAEDHSVWESGDALFVDDDPGCAGSVPCFSTLAAAVSAARSNDVLYVLPGTYAGPTIEQTERLSNLRIHALEGPSSTFISGACLLVTGDSRQSGEIWLQGFTFLECSPDGGQDQNGWGIAASGANVRILDNVFTGPFATSAVGLRDVRRATVARNRFLDHHGESAALDVEVLTEQTDGHCVRIENNLVARSDWGIQASAPRVEIVNNTIVQNANALGFSEHSLVANNILFGNEHDFGIGAELGGDYDFQYNLVGGGQFTGLNHNFAADPLLVDKTAGNFELLPGSPAEDAGNGVVAPREDIRGFLRESVAALGAFLESAVGGPAPDGIACLDRILTNGPTTLPEGSFVGYETCEDESPGDGDGCSSHCQLEARGSLGVLSLFGSNLCVVRADESLECWGQVAERAPAGAFREVAVGQDHACGLGLDGAVACWRISGLSLEFSPSGTFSHIVSDGNSICGLEEDGSVACWADQGAVVEELSGPFVRIDAGCAVDAAGDVTCWRGEPPDPQSGPYVQVAADVFGKSCGLRASGELRCPPQDGIVAPTAPRTGLVSIHTSNNQACGLRPDGRALRWVTGSIQELLSERSFVDVQAGFGLCCGVTAERKVWCSPSNYGFPAE